MTSTNRSSRKTDGQLKRPDLRGEFSCEGCSQKFSHVASLNRHLRLRCAVQTCLLCNQILRPEENVRDHMRIEHNLSRIYVCSCCGCSFLDRKALIEHVKSMESIGTFGNVTPIAKSEKKDCRNFPNANFGSLSPQTSSESESTLTTRPATPVINETPVFEAPKLETLEFKAPESPAPESPASDTTDQEIIYPQEVLEEAWKILRNQAVDTILERENFSSEQITQPKTWEYICLTANQMVDQKIENILHGEMMLSVNDETPVKEQPAEHDGVE